MRLEGYGAVAFPWFFFGFAQLFQAAGKMSEMRYQADNEMA
jgi:hypothetical protein